MILRERQHEAGVVGLGRGGIEGGFIQEGIEREQAGPVREGGIAVGAVQRAAGAEEIQGDGCFVCGGGALLLNLFQEAGRAVRRFIALRSFVRAAIAEKYIVGIPLNHIKQFCFVRGGHGSGSCAASI